MYARHGNHDFPDCQTHVRRQGELREIVGGEIILGGFSYEWPELIRALFTSLPREQQQETLSLILVAKQLSERTQRE